MNTRVHNLSRAIPPQTLPIVGAVRPDWGSHTSDECAAGQACCYPTGRQLKYPKRDVMMIVWCDVDDVIWCAVPRMSTAFYGSRDCDPRGADGVRLIRILLVAIGVRVY
jgi:hypothetical protein